MEKNSDKFKFSQRNSKPAGKAAVEKRAKRAKKVLTPEQKRKKKKRALIGTAVTVLILAAFIGATALAGHLGASANSKMIKGFEVAGSTLTPEIDSETGYWTFTTDGDFKVLQLTDIHIGGGGFSIQTDKKALTAVSTLISAVKPDLVIITGDIAYPVPFQAGTFNNYREAQLFAELMEQKGVYWAPCFGNHDSEVYSMYNREEVSDFYSREEWKHCLYQEGPENIFGSGNYIINVKNSLGLITQSLVIFDSNSYTKGVISSYDNIHQDQIDWYSSQITALNNLNKGVFAALDAEAKAAYALELGTTVEDFAASSMIKSSMFFHIPLREYETAWMRYVNNGYKDDDEVKYILGEAKEPGMAVCAGVNEDNLFETADALGSTQGMFTGHDHLNNFSIEYKGIRLTYGLSIDYLAYLGIGKKTDQRGGTVITYSQDGSMNVAQKKLVDC